MNLTFLHESRLILFYLNIHLLIRVLASANFHYLIDNKQGKVRRAELPAS